MLTYVFAIPGIAVLVIGVLIVKRHPAIAILLFFMGMKLCEAGGTYAAIYRAHGG